MGRGSCPPLPSPRADNGGPGPRPRYPAGPKQAGLQGPLPGAPLLPGKGGRKGGWAWSDRRRLRPSGWGGGTGAAPGTRRRSAAGQGGGGPGGGAGGSPGTAQGLASFPTPGSRPQTGHRDKAAGDLGAPKQRVPANPVPSPRPPARGFECKQSGRARSVPRPACGRPLPARDPAREGRGLGARSPHGVPDTPGLPLSLTPGWAGRRGARMCPTRETGAASRWVPGAGPGGGPSPLPATSGGRWAAVRPGTGPAELGKLAFQDTPPPGRNGRGATAGKSDPTTLASVQARPKLSIEGGGAGAARGPGEAPGRGPDRTRTLLAASSALGPPGCRLGRPRSSCPPTALSCAPRSRPRA